jgi:cytosine permease
MATQTEALPPALPDYIRAAQPNPPTKRAPWYANTAPTYAGIFLWFVFWDELPNAGLDLGGLGTALLAIVLAGAICHFLFYLVPGLLGQQTGLPLYIVGTSTFGATGGLLMPGFLMGLLQFGWLAVNTYFSSSFLAEAITGKPDNPLFYVLCVVWAAGAAFVGLKGIQYVAKVATFLPLIPLAVLLLALFQFGGSATGFKPAAVGHNEASATTTAFAMMVALIVGFFATAGAAGVDFGMNNRDKRDVHMGGIVGIWIATLFTAGIAVIAVAGANAPDGVLAGDAKSFTVTNALKMVVGPTAFSAIKVGLTLAAFPGACFSSFIAANSFKTVMPRVNSFVSVGLGALVSITLAVTGLAKDLPSVFGIIGASFGPICGAMLVDYLLAGKKWAGPRAGFNPAGWVAWLLGFGVGILPNLHAKWPAIPDVPAAPVAAFAVGAIVYFVLAKAGMESQVIPYGPAQQQAA